MSRNKIILLIGIVALLYLALPNEGIYLSIKANMIAIAPYILVAIIIYMLITINLLKKALYKLTDNLCDENVFRVVKYLGLSFDVKRMIGTVNLLNIYKRVNAEKKISFEAKDGFFQVLKKKRIDTPTPSGAPKGGRK